MATTGKMALVNKEDKELSIKRQCELLDLARSRYYYEPASESETNLNLMKEIDKLHLKYPFYGVKRMRAALSTDAVPLNDKRIRRLMRKMGIETVYPKRNLSKPCRWNLRFPYLLRNLSIERPDQVWSIDITYIPMAKGFMYLCAIIDWHTRYLLSWTLSNTLTSDFCIEALEEAINQYGLPGIINTDQGSQFTSDLFIEAVLGKGIKLSMDGKGRATDNIAIERFWRSLKYEDIYLYSYENSIELYLGIVRYVHFYNTVRQHQSLSEKTPESVYKSTKKEEEEQIAAFTT